MVHNTLFYGVESFQFTYALGTSRRPTDGTTVVLYFVPHLLQGRQWYLFYIHFSFFMRYTSRLNSYYFVPGSQVQHANKL